MLELETEVAKELALAPAGKRDRASTLDEIPERFIKCDGNLAFKCKDGYHPTKKCTHNSTAYLELRRSLTEHAYHLARDKPSLERCIAKYDW